MKERPIKPVDNALWWTEHVLKYGGDHLMSPASHMTFAEYYEAKLILVILTVLLLILFLTVLIIKKILNTVKKHFIIHYKIKLH